MGATLSLIPELEEVVQHGSREKRVATLQRITALFLDGASRYKDEHIDLFDDVFGLLIEEIETKARAELSNHLAPVGNAPVNVLRKLANDDDIAVAGPVLKLAPRLPEVDLIGVAQTKSQAHLEAISARRTLGEAVTDVLVRRGDREVARRIAGNRGARISETGFSSLVKRAEVDGVLAEKVGLRPDIPEPMFRELLTKATAVVQTRLLASARPDLKAEIHRVLAKVSKEVGARVGPHDYTAAQRTVLGLDRAGRLNEAALAAFCSDGKYEETVVALAALAKVPIHVVERLMGGDRPDAVLILCKAARLSWATVKAVIMTRPDRTGTSSQGLDGAFANYGRLSASTARRVVRFWQVRQDR
ncbi:MAG TPA: DUF2336 domain-containing protein [Xanthobacteraceae bacterium]|nr:DUF2336 domain-containing protein [Xanthobacteraceae bacterium]